MAELFDSYVKLLLHFDGNDAAAADIDYSGQNHILTFAANAQLDTAQKAFGLSSLLVDGAGDFVSIPTSSDFEFGSADWTIDCLVRVPSVVTDDFVYSFDYPGGGAANIIALSVQTDGNPKFFMEVFNHAATRRFAFGTTVVQANTWYRLAFVRDGNTLRLFVEGTEENTINCTGDSYNTNTSARTFYIGSRSATSSFISAWIDELRISKGIARWTGNFTPPPYAYQPIARAIVL